MPSRREPQPSPGKGGNHTFSTLPPRKGNCASVLHLQVLPRPVARCLVSGSGDRRESWQRSCNASAGSLGRGTVSNREWRNPLLSPHRTAGGHLSRAISSSNTQASERAAPPDESAGQPPGRASAARSGLREDARARRVSCRKGPSPRQHKYVHILSSFWRVLGSYLPHCVHRSSGCSPGSLMMMMVVVVVVSGVQNNRMTSHVHPSLSDRPSKSTTHGTPSVAMTVLLTPFPMLSSLSCDRTYR